MAEVMGSCHCGAVRIILDAAPETVTECNCSICRRYGVLWAYYAPNRVRFEPSEPVTDTYQQASRTLAFHRCRTCGCVTHWAPLAGRDPNRMGINARMLDPIVLAAAQVRHLDGAVTERYID
ncbi:GFA family protein [Devosia lacusdianchii]|uniref:GFA family protein n=1 Tax=Devosia lacusdianchii TaxID=2917991 RepID=UPI001F059EDE|nr:GFA family protein [Devosia sp. JXJ CY 41]